MNRTAKPPNRRMEGLGYSDEPLGYSEGTLGIFNMKKAGFGKPCLQNFNKYLSNFLFREKFSS